MPRFKCQRLLSCELCPDIPHVSSVGAPPKTSPLWGEALMMPDTHVVPWKAIALFSAAALSSFHTVTPPSIKPRFFLLDLSDPLDPGRSPVGKCVIGVKCFICNGRKEILRITKCGVRLFMLVLNSVQKQLVFGTATGSGTTWVRYPSKN